MLTKNGIPLPCAFTGAEAVTEVLIHGIGPFMAFGTQKDIFAVVNAARENNNRWVTLSSPCGIKEGRETIFVADDIRVIASVSVQVKKLWDGMQQAQNMQAAAEARAQKDAGEAPKLVPMDPERTERWGSNEDKTWDELGTPDELGTQPAGRTPPEDPSAA